MWIDLLRKILLPTVPYVHVVCAPSFSWAPDCTSLFKAVCTLISLLPLPKGSQSSLRSICVQSLKDAGENAWWELHCGGKLDSKLGPSVTEL